MKQDSKKIIPRHSSMFAIIGLLSSLLILGCRNDSKSATEIEQNFAKQEITFDNQPTMQIEFQDDENSEIIKQFLASEQNINIPEDLVEYLKKHELALIKLPESENNYRIISIHEGLLIDVRTPREFAAGHLPGAILIPYDEISQVIDSVTMKNKSLNLLLYCRSGNRSGIAMQELHEMGYKNAVNEGGMQEIIRRSAQQ